MTGKQIAWMSLLILSMIWIIGCDSVSRKFVGVWQVDEGSIVYHYRKIFDAPRQIVITKEDDHYRISCDLVKHTVFGSSMTRVTYQAKYIARVDILTCEPPDLPDYMGDMDFYPGDSKLSLHWGGGGNAFASSLTSFSLAADYVRKSGGKNIQVELPKTITGKDGAEMVLIPAGEFQMGINGEDNAQPIHTVYVHAFYMDKYEVTNRQYRRFVESTEHREPEGHTYIDAKYTSGFKPWSDPNFSGADQPVVCVSWEDANAYAKWAGKRLPTEAEWEKASRGGFVGMEYPWGNKITEENANYGRNIGSTTPVGNYPPNGYGLYDMAGNVFEWCADWYDSGYYSSSPKRNPTGPSSGEKRVLRGGSWYYDQYSLPCAFRYDYGPTGTDSNVGFRCCASRGD